MNQYLIAIQLPDNYDRPADAEAMRCNASRLLLQ
jgi:hypothetical protein